jgi:hypothetical protein
MKDKLPTDQFARTVIARASLALIVTMVVMKIHAEVSITFSSTPNGLNQQSDGSPLDTSFTFELGTFTDGFVPSSSNTDMWSDKWSPLSDATGSTEPGAITNYRTINGLFGETYDGFNSTADLAHNDDPFETSDQGYIWGYDSRGAGQNEWVLITNDGTNPSDDPWLFPNTGGIGGFGEAWDVAGADHAILGDINFLDDKNDFISLQTASVNGPPVPEPSTALILGVGAATLGLRRRRRRVSDG